MYIFSARRGAPSNVPTFEPHVEAMEVEDNIDLDTVPEDQFGPIEDETGDAEEREESRTIKQVKHLAFFQVFFIVYNFYRGFVFNF